MVGKASVAAWACLVAVLSTLLFMGVVRAPADAYEPDNNAGSATTIVSSGSSANHSIFPSGDEDWFTFTRNSSATVVLETSGPSGDSIMDLYESDGSTSIASDDDGGTDFFSRIAWPLAAGTYFVRVRGFALGEIDNYTLTYAETAGGGGDPHEPDDSAAAATPISVGTNSTGHSIFPAIDEDWWVFTLTATTRVTVMTQGDSGDTTGDTIMYLYQGDGTTLITFDDDDGPFRFSRIDHTLGTGTYYVRVITFGGIGTINVYHLTLTGSSVAPPADSSALVWILAIGIIAVVVVIVVLIVALRSRAKRPPVAIPPGPAMGQPGQPWPPQAPPPPQWPQGPGSGGGAPPPPP